RGVIDRIDRTEGGWRIIDYKSGRPIARRRRDLQVALYALGATSALRLDHLELEVVYLAGGGSVRVDKVDGLVHEAEVEGAQAPIRDATTKSTFGVSWPGRKPVITSGRPVARASAIAPGPALVTTRSQARISSGMYSTKPNTSIGVETSSS